MHNREHTSSDIMPCDINDVSQKNELNNAQQLKNKIESFNL